MDSDTSIATLKRNIDHAEWADGRPGNWEHFFVPASPTHNAWAVDGGPFLLPPINSQGTDDRESSFSQAQQAGRLCT